LGSTDPDRFWPGVWREDTNGWRVQLSFDQSNTPAAKVTVAVGSIVRNAGGNYYPTPDGRFLKFELLDPQGAIVPTKKASLETNYPPQLSTWAFPREPDGEIKIEFGFVSNGPPFVLGACRFNEACSIRREGDYQLTVCPVLYRDGKTVNLFDRVELPCVSTRIHLVPPPENQ
jgi:hypothetical protein